MKNLTKPVGVLYPHIKKLLLIMRLSVLLILIAVFTSTASVYSQVTKLTLKMENARLSEVFDAIEKQSEFYFFYNRDYFNDDRIVSVDVENKLVDEVLKELLKGEAITWEIFDRNILLRIPEAPLTTAQQELIQQQPAVFGTVTDESGLPLPGVTVLIKGTTQGTVTNADGNYALTDIPEDATLVFSFVGMQTQEIAIVGKTLINVTMVVDAIGIEEVVAVGYGTLRKSDITGAVASMREDQFNPGTFPSIEQLILGKSSGVSVMQNSSEPGGGISVRIRGVTSANAGSEPLYVIDGLPIDNSPLLGGGGTAGIGYNQPRNPLNSLNPNDIESIEILKDASATAIYGSRGANGVILITTKKGKTGQTGISYSGNAGVQTAENRYDLLNSQEYMRAMNEISIAEGRTAIFTEDQINTISGTDWQDVILRNALVQDHTVSVTGGREKTKFFASFNYYNQEGIILNTGIERYTGRINLEQEISSRLNFGINFNTSVIKDNNSIDNSAINEFAGPLYSALLYDPTESIYDESGELTRSSALTVQNPMRLIRGISSHNLTNRTMGTTYFTYNITNDLQAKINLGTDRINTRRDIYNSRLTFFGNTTGGQADISTIERTNTLLEYTLTYNKQVNEKSRLNAVVGSTYQLFTNRSFAGNIAGFPSDDLGTNNFNLGNSDLDNLSSYRQESKLLSYLGRVNYSLQDKYLFTGSFRIDGSSKFGPNNRFGYFPSLAVAWRISQEDFMPTFFDDLKLRVSWGQIGNEAIGNYEYLVSLVPGNEFAVINDNIVTGIKPTRIANADLKWETTEQIDVGFDAIAFKGRLSATFDYFIKNTKDMLYNRPMPRSSGFSSRRENIGSMQNKGIELQLSTINFTNSNFKWTTTVNFSHIVNEVTSLGGLNELVSGFSIIKEGEPLHSYYGYKMIGFFQEGEDIASSAQPNAKPGEPKFENYFEEDNVIDAKDMQILGSPFPDFTFGLQNTLNYKNFQFDFFIQGMEGASLINQNLVESLYPLNFRRNRIAETILDRWTPKNPDAKWPSSVNAQGYAGARTINSMTVQDASYIRLKNVQLSYNFPLSGNSAIKGARIYVTGQNLYTLTKYIGFDPEASSNGSSAARRDYSGYPLARVWSLGVKIDL